MRVGDVAGNSCQPTAFSETRLAATRERARGAARKSGAAERRVVFHLSAAAAAGRVCDVSAPPPSARGGATSAARVGCAADLITAMHRRVLPPPHRDGRRLVTEAPPAHKEGAATGPPPRATDADMSPRSAVTCSGAP